MNKLIMKSLLLSGAMALTQCSDNDNPATSDQDKPFINADVAVKYVGTQSPGDVWSWSLDKQQGHMSATWDYGTFDDPTDDIYIEGTFISLPSGFLKVTITKSIPQHPEIPTNGTAWFYALEIPNMAMIIKPEGSIKGDIITMVPQGECASIPGTYNYIVTAPGERSAYNPIVNEAFGYLEAETSGPADFKLSGFKFSLDCINGGNCSETGEITGLPMASCTGGGAVEITSEGNTVAQGQFTNAGAMMMDFGYGNGGVFALKADANATKAALLNNTYNGIAYMPKNENDKTVPVKLSFFTNDLGNMIGTGHPYTSLETATVNNDEGAVVLVEDVINGRVLGSMNFDNDKDVSEMAAALLVKGNDQIMIVSSYDEESLNPIILILVKKN
jgi:hypothetical protein